jgi:hypothetical protein
MTCAKIVYREFYDVPRVFLVSYMEYFFLFESLFNEEQDDYLKIYEVYLMPNLTQEEINGSWKDINQRAIRKICEVGIDEVKFDPTLRKEMDIDLLKQLISKL